MFAAKSSDTSRNTTTTLTADPDLKLPGEAGKRYAFEILMWTQAANANPDFKFSLVGPSGCVIRWGPIEQGANTFFTPTTAAAKTCLLAGDVYIVAGSGTTGPYGVLLKGTIKYSATPGDMEVQWAQNTSDAGNSSVLAESHIKYNELP